MVSTAKEVQLHGRKTVTSSDTIYQTGNSAMKLPTIARNFAWPGKNAPTLLSTKPPRDATSRIYLQQIRFLWADGQELYAGTIDPDILLSSSNPDLVLQTGSASADPCNLSNNPHTIIIV